MAIHTFQVDLKTQLVEALPLEESRDARPHSGLVPTENFDMKGFSLIRLENEWITLVLCPALGGRILELVSKQDKGGLELPTQIKATTGGARGARCPDGIQWFSVSADGASSMGFREVSLMDDDEAPAVLIHDFDAKSQVATYAKLELLPDAASVRVSLRCTNRGLRDVPFTAGVQMPPILSEISSRFAQGVAFRDPVSGGGLAVTGVEGTIAGVESGQAWVWRTEDGPLRPHQVFSTTFEVSPFHTEYPVQAVGRGAIIASDDTALEICSAQGHSEVIVQIRDAQGDPFEARTPLGPGKKFATTLAGNLANPSLLSVRTAQEVLASTGQAAHPLPSIHGDPGAELNGIPATWDAATLTHLAKGRDLGGPARFALAAIAASRKEWEEADAHLVEAINLNAECELLWWFKAAISRNRGDDATEEDPNLLNAHYLSPMDPLLRAEAFLGLGMSLGAEPNPMLAALHEYPDKVVEVACQYIRVGLHSDASRWIDESLRHAENFRLRLLQAWLLATYTRMEVEAAQHLAKISEAAVVAPLLSDPIEELALMQLCERFPDLPILFFIARLG